MVIDRRNFIKASAGGAIGLSLGTAPKTLAAATTLKRVGTAPRHPMSILILGGTSFLGPHQIRYALERGHNVTTFTRGQTQPTIHTNLFEHVEALVGDRSDDLGALRGRTWDAVIDNSGQRVEWTRRSAQLLKDSVGRYVYTSSTGVYLPYLGDDITESTALLTRDDPPQERPSYGVMKTLSEDEARQAFGADRTTVVRPTYIIGPADPSNRFPYWPARLARGGEVLVPGSALDPVQYIDVRDLTEFMIRLIENETAGTYNVAGPGSRQGMHAFVHGVHAAMSSEVDWVMVPDYDFLKQHELRFNIPWLMPEGDYYGSARINVDAAKDAGLTYRPLAKSTWDVIEWWQSNAVTDERRQQAWSGGRGAFALDLEREASIIAAWRAR